MGKIEIDFGQYEKIGSNDIMLLPAIAYISTHYCKKLLYGQSGVTLYRGINIQWWNYFFEIRYISGNI